MRGSPNCLRWDLQIGKGAQLSCHQGVILSPELGVIGRCQLAENVMCARPAKDGLESCKSKTVLCQRGRARRDLKVVSGREVGVETDIYTRAGG